MLGLRRYAAVWRVPGGPVLLVFGLLARLGIAMTPLGMLLLIQQATGRYATAALAGAVYSLAFAAVSPAVGRFADRIGPAPILLASVAAHPVGLAALILVTRAPDPSLAWIVGTSALGGATYPPLVAALRGVWSGLTEPDGDHAHLRDAALAAETALYQCVFVVGPLLVAILAAIASPAAVIAVSAAVTVLGTVVLARGRAMRVRPRPLVARADGPGPLRTGGFPAMLFCAAGLGVCFGATSVTVPAYATAHGGESGALAALLVAVLGAGSVLGGVLYGAREARAPLSRQFPWLLAAIAASYTAYAFMPEPAALAVALLLGGALVAPVLTVENSLVGRMVPPRVRTEAYTWVVMVEVTAAAGGIQAAGLIVDRPGGVPWSFVFAGSAVAVAAVVAARPTGSIARAAAL